MKQHFKITILILASFAILNMHSNATTALELYESRYIVDMPTAGILENMSYSINSQLVSNGGFILDFTASFFKFLNISLSYGGTGIVGSRAMNMQKFPGIHAKARILNETETAPAIALGINTQGHGTYTYVLDRYEQLPPDVYAAVSKAFKWSLGTLSLNGGVNYSFEDKDNRGINIYAGIEQSITKFVAIAFEINPNLNDKSKLIWGDNNALMFNGAIKVAPSENMFIEIQLKDFFRNSQYSEQVGRFFGVQFVSKFF